MRTLFSYICCNVQLDTSIFSITLNKSINLNVLKYALIHYSFAKCILLLQYENRTFKVTEIKNGKQACVVRKRCTELEVYGFVNKDFFNPKYGYVSQI